MSDRPCWRRTSVAYPPTHQKLERAAGRCGVDPRLMSPVTCSTPQQLCRQLGFRPIAIGPGYPPAFRTVSVPVSRLVTYAFRPSGSTATLVGESVGTFAVTPRLSVSMTETASASTFAV